MNYAKVLFELKVDEEIVAVSKEILLKNTELVEALENPTIKREQKHAVIEKLFDKAICSFLKLLCDHNMIEHVADIFEAYEEISLENKKMIKAKFSFVTRPSEAQIQGIKQMICKKYNKKDVLLQLKEDASLVGGFVLKVGDIEYDRSIKGKLLDLQKTLSWR